MTKSPSKSECIQKFLFHSSNKCVIFSCNMQNKAEAKAQVETVYNYLKDDIGRQNKYARAITKIPYRLEKLNARGIDLDKYFNYVGENDRALFVLIYKDKKEKKIELIKHLLQNYKAHQKRFKIAIITDPRDKDDLNIIKSFLPKKSQNFTCLCCD